MQKYLFLHIDLTTVVICVGMTLLLRQPIARALNSLAAWYKGSSEPVGFWWDISKKVVVTIAVAILTTTLSISIFQLYQKAGIAGRYDAYDIVDGQAMKWGSVSLTYSMFRREYRGILENDAGDVEVEIEAVLDRAQYLRGHYAEASNPNRRRLGAFLMELSGSGTEFEGPYVFLDPANGQPTVGRARWIRQ